MKTSSLTFSFQGMFLLQNMRIANAYELAAGNDPSDVSFDHEKMLKHLVQCLKKDCFSTFSAIVEHRSIQ